MDPAVALVQAYLQMNGYFTVTEYSVVEAAGRSNQYRMSTDLDVLAVRFPGAGHAVVRRRRRRRDNPAAARSASNTGRLPARRTWPGLARPQAAARAACCRQPATVPAR